MTRARWIGSLAAAVLLIGACLGSSRGGNSCACGGEPPAPSPGDASVPAAAAPQPAASAPALEPAPAPAASAATVLPDFTGPSWNRVPSRAGTYLVCWRSTSGKVPRNEDFELEVWVLRDGAPVDVELEVRGWMPDHGHGMLRAARTAKHDGGGFRIEGMLLHMRGTWQLQFDVFEGTQSETAESVITL